MAIPSLTAAATLRTSRSAGGAARPSPGRGIVPQEYYTIQACTRRLAQSEPGAVGLPGLKHCYLRFTSLNESAQYPSFTKSFGPGEAGPEHFEAAATTRCHNVGTSQAGGARVFTFNQVMGVVSLWDTLAAQHGRYSVLDNNCCSHVIQTLEAALLPVPSAIRSCNLHIY